MPTDEPPPALAGPTSPTQKTTVLTRGLALLAVVALLAFIVVESRTLYREWTALQVDQANVRGSAVIGYQNIARNPSYAQKPADWFHDEGEHSFLWSGWKDGDGHHWFRINRGEVELTRISMPIGRDVVQAVDYPLVEIGGGTIWRRIPDDAPVVGHELGGVRAVYPMLVLDKVWIINDRLGDRPCLVAYNPLGPREAAVVMYDPVLDGQRLTMGSSGYFHDHKPLLYDRGTESLWVADGDTLRAIAGRLKGSGLRVIGRPSPSTWGDWRTHHPKSRLLVGADRSQPQPPL